jgi:hypothetical protein
MDGLPDTHRPEGQPGMMDFGYVPGSAFILSDNGVIVPGVEIRR